MPIVPKDTFTSFEEYKKSYYDSEDQFKYEWNNGIIERTESRKQSELSIVNVLSRRFYQTRVFKEGGVLRPIDMWTSKIQYRRPDLAIFLGRQLPEMTKGNNQIAQWVGEIISPTDTKGQVYKKLLEYFAAGVKVVWHIFPELDEVHVYTAPNEVSICSGKRICSGQPALVDFEIKAEEIFAY